MQITDTMKHRDKKMAFPRREEDATFYILLKFHILYFTQVPHVLDMLPVYKLTRSLAYFIILLAPT